VLVLWVVHQLLEGMLLPIEINTQPETFHTLSFEFSMGFLGFNLVIYYNYLIPNQVYRALKHLAYTAEKTRNWMTSRVMGFTSLALSLKFARASLLCVDVTHFTESKERLTSQKAKKD